MITIVHIRKFIDFICCIHPKKPSVHHSYKKTSYKGDKINKVWVKACGETGGFSLMTAVIADEKFREWDEKEFEENA